MPLRHDWRAGSDAGVLENAREVRRLFEATVSRAKLDYGVEADSLTLKVKHVLGKEPTPENIPELAMALEELDRCVGIPHVKNVIKEIVVHSQENYRRELRGDPVIHLALHRLFLGNPGMSVSWG